MGIHWIIETHDSLPSTQDAVREMARAGKPEGIVVQALQQTSGRGRHGRSWISEKGNFYLSLMLKPSSDARHIGQMGLLAGVAAAETIRKYLRDPDLLVLKWPNDLLLNNLKCAGILVETQLTGKNSLSWVAIGIGANITSAPRGLGEAIEKHASKPFGLNAFRTSFLTHMDKYYTLWTKEGFDPIKENWLKYAHPKGTKVRVRIGSEVVEGIFSGIDDEGNLLLHDRHLNRRKVGAGEIYLHR